MIHALRNIVLIGALALLSACAVKQSPLEAIEAQQLAAQTQARWQMHRAAMLKLDHWRVKGKIAVKAGSKGGHATLRWDKSSGIQKIDLYGPLGGGRVEIESDAGGVRLKDTRGGQLTGTSITKLIEQRLGWPLPFDQLPDWLRGLPSSEQAAIEWDEAGNIVRMNDQGWQVSYPEYQLVNLASVGEVSVPRMIELNALPGTLKVYDMQGAYLGEDFFIRMIVKSWQ